VRAPDLYLAVAEWVGVTPRSATPESEEREDLRLSSGAARQVRAVVGGTDPVAVDQWCARNLLMPLGGKHQERYDLDNPDSTLSRFLRYYREVYGGGTLDPALVKVV
jgi:hypothetical protein